MKKKSNKDTLVFNSIRTIPHILFFTIFLGLWGYVEMSLLLAANISGLLAVWSIGGIVALLIFLWGVVGSENFEICEELVSVERHIGKICIAKKIFLKSDIRKIYLVENQNLYQLSHSRSSFSFMKFKYLGAIVLECLKGKYYVGTELNQEQAEYLIDQLREHYGSLIVIENPEKKEDDTNIDGFKEF